MKEKSEGTSKKSNLASSLEIGCMVNHPKWGTGKIVEIEGTGDKVKVIVEFETEGEKKLLLKYAKLKKIT